MKGNSTFRLQQPGDNCAPKFRQGEEVLVYLHPSKQSGAWEAYGCSRSRLSDQSADDLLFLRALPASATRSRLSGEVELYENSPEGFRRVRALNGVRINIRGDGKLFQTTTNADGIYEVYDLPDGMYEVEPVIPKGMVTQLPRMAGRRPLPSRGPIAQIPMRAGAGMSASFVVREDNAIAARIVGPEGQPLEGVHVALLPVVTASRDVLVSAFSNADGTFQLKGFAAGDYLLVANGRGAVTGSTPFGAVYFPGTTKREEARTLTVAPGQHVEDLTLRIPKLERTITVTGRVRFSDGVPATGAHVYLVQDTERAFLSRGTDRQGEFSGPVLARRAAKIQAEWSLPSRDVFDACPQYHGTGSNELLSSFPTNELSITGEKDESSVVLTLPVKSCPSAPPIP